MTKFLLTLCAFSLLFACSTTNKEVITPTEQPVTKTIEFTIATAADYSAANYDSASAEIKLTVYKPLYDPYREQILWDTVIARQQLREFMKMQAPLVITKTFTNWYDNKDKIGAGYSISYITKPFTYPTWFAFGGLAERGNTNFKVAVAL